MLGQNRRDLFLNYVLQLVAFIGFSLISLPAQPFGNYLTDFNNTYGTAGSRIDNCGLCHYDFNGGGVHTPYGEDFLNNNYSVINIGLFDSDGDGFNNDQESSLSILIIIRIYNIVQCDPRHFIMYWHYYWRDFFCHFDFGLLTGFCLLVW